MRPLNVSQEYAVYGSMVLPPAERVLNLATHSKVSGIPGVATVVVKLFFNLYRLWAGGLLPGLYGMYAPPTAAKISVDAVKKLFSFSSPTQNSLNHFKIKTLLLRGRTIVDQYRKRQ